MKKFRKVWTAELNAWLLTTKGMRPRTAYSLFLETFPQITDVTECAFKNQRSRMGAAGKCSNPNGTRKPRPLYSEQVKKGYVRIKIAQPNVWVSKAKWVYMETHPWEDFTERSYYVFLDGDNRNFSPDNIERVPLRLMGLFSGFGGCEEGNPEVTRLRILQARLKYTWLDAGEKMGLVVKYGTARYFRQEYNAKIMAYNSRPERRERVAELARARRHKMKKENPLKYQAMLDKNNERRKAKRK